MSLSTEMNARKRMNYSSPLYDHYVALVAKPVSPIGVRVADTRFSPEYEALEGLINNASSVHGAGHANWSEIQESAENLLRTQPQDLRVTVWLIWALQQCKPFEGLFAGLGLLRYQCEHHWQALHPHKSRGRLGAVQWLISRLDVLFSNDVAGDQPQPLLQAILEQLVALEKVFTARFAIEAPVLLPMCRRLSSMLEQVAVRQSCAQSTTVVEQAAPSSKPPDLAIHSDTGGREALREQQERARLLCARWLLEDPTDIRAFRLLRTMVWLGITKLPDCDAEFVTPLRCLPKGKLEEYGLRHGQADFANLIPDVEGSLARSPFWLDGHRMVWECLRGLNAEGAMREVEGQLAILLRRIPGLEGLRFHDGQPFADAATQAWLKTTVATQPPASAATDTPAGGGQGSVTVDAVLHDAYAILAKQGVSAAVQSIKKQMQASESGRERFQWQLCLARLSHMAGKYELAFIQLEILDEQSRRAGLHVWEPELSRSVLELLRDCAERLPKTPALAERKQGIYRRLCHFDLGALTESSFEL